MNQPPPLQDTADISPFVRRRHPPAALILLLTMSQQAGLLPTAHLVTNEIRRRKISFPFPFRAERRARERWRRGLASYGDIRLHISPFRSHLWSIHTFWKGASQYWLCCCCCRLQDSTGSFFFSRYLKDTWQLIRSSRLRTLPRPESETAINAHQYTQPTLSCLLNRLCFPFEMIAEGTNKPNICWIQRVSFLLRHWRGKANSVSSRLLCKHDLRSFFVVFCFCLLASSRVQPQRTL